MNRVVPWADLVAAIELAYPRAEGIHYMTTGVSRLQPYSGAGFTPPSILFRSSWWVALETEATGHLWSSSSGKQTQARVDGESSILGIRQLRPPLLRAHQAATR